MKRKFLLSIMAMSLAIVSLFTFTACKDGDSGAKTVSNEEFSKGVKASFDNFVDSHADYDNYGEYKVVASADIQDVYDTEWRYTPDGADEPIYVTYTNTESIKANVVYNVKRIGGELFVSMEATHESSSVEYDDFLAPTNAPLTAEKDKYLANKKLLFGVENGVYYLRVESNVQQGEETLGDPVVTKEYKTFATKADYAEAVMNYLGDIEFHYALMPYQLFSQDETTMLLFTLPKTVENGVYSFVAEMAMPRFDIHDKESSLYSMKEEVGFSSQGPAKIVMDVDNEESVMNMVANFEYASSLSAPTNAIEGYTLNNDLKASDYFIAVFANF